MTLALAFGVAEPQRPAEIALETLIIAEDRRASRQGDYELIAAVAGSHPSAVMRAKGVRALGRLEQRLAPARQPADLIEKALGDPDPLVRRGAAYALAQSVSTLDAAAKGPRRAALLARLAHEEDDQTAGAMLESAARLADPSSIAEVEAAVLAQTGLTARRAAMASALEILARRAGKPGVLSARAADWLRAEVVDSRLPPAARREALLALVTARSVDAGLAAQVFEDADWQLRRLAVGAAAPRVVDAALGDADPHVRYEAVRAVARRGAEGCAALPGAVRDPDSHVALAAIDALGRCADPAHITVLAALAATPGGVGWHRASHALVALAAADPARAHGLVASHAEETAWPVRMYAAHAAARVADDSALARLAADAHPNVREAAIAGFVARAKDAASAGVVRPMLKTAVLAALAERRDPQLLRTAAHAANATGDAPAFKDALLDALDAIDGAGGETTRDARAAIVEALKIAAPGMAPPAPSRPREPMTPSAQELRSLPSRARIQMVRGGVIELELLWDEAPASVARFARLARARYYDGLTFHRVVPNFVVQGGSPWANEYAGAPRFQRDELGFARHERGAVGISTRGRDTGDAQIFIDLVDLPRLNHDYTVFARVVSGMDVVDGILEADVIQRISILK
ncbi:MAG TPA: peptidylprolyl isomerase [Vicinamibacterales bacterium]|nr:peptidylprolyl isomerase [Vicinamibacterales bacterium]